ncbi:MAG: hypothetical protein C0490_11010 [Marivirga sp.]|nr:hypothetical protein [Marivirga sp.]
MNLDAAVVLLNSIYNDLLNAKELVYDKCGFALTNLEEEIESTDYRACTFRLNELEIKYRVSKITPTKTGQFVAIWKRNQNGLTVPFDVSDAVDFIIITARNSQKFGQFIFPKHVLLDRAIISGNNRDGKRGVRVYPPWDQANSKQAEKTQKWQTEYFLDISRENTIDLPFAKKLLNNR